MSSSVPSFTPLDGGTRYVAACSLSRESEPDRTYDVHGAVVIKVVGQDPVSDVIDRTLTLFKSSPKAPDLTLVLGGYPSQEWEPTGTLVGDRFLYDLKSGTTTVLSRRAMKRPGRSEAEYIIKGDLRTPGESVTVYVPKLRTPTVSWKSLGNELGHGNLRRAMLALAGNPFGMQKVVHQAERITEAILEPFLFYRLPAKGLSFVHAASVCSQGSATLFTGSANIGKSTLALHFVREKMAFLGDSLVILGENGKVLPYPGLTKLHAGHLKAFPELTTRLTAGMGSIGAYLLRTELSAGPEATVELLPQREMVELFENVTIPTRCEVETVVLVRRGSYSSATCEEIDPKSMAEFVAAELYWEFEATPWRKEQFIYTPSAASGRDFFQEAAAQHTKVDEILQRGISKAKCYKVELPLEAPVKQVGDLLPDILGSKKE
jgi:hypothetical protein